MRMIAGYRPGSTGRDTHAFVGRLGPGISTSSVTVRYTALSSLLGVARSAAGVANHAENSRAMSGGQSLLGTIVRDATAPHRPPPRCALAWFRHAGRGQHRRRRMDL